MIGDNTMKLRRKICMFAGLAVALYVIMKLYYLLEFHEAQPISTTRRIKSGGRSYVLALCYSEQLSAATHTMLQLSALALDWRANLVETTLFKSFLFGIEGIYPPHLKKMTNHTSALRLFEVYNSTLVNDHLHKKLSPLVTMDSYENFLSHASREVTLIHFSTERSITQHVRRISPDSSLDLLRIKWAFYREASTVDCSASNFYGFHKLVKRIEHQLNHKRLSPQSMHKPFKVSRILCLNPRSTYTSKTLSQYVALPGTVIFTNWLGCCWNECTIHNLIPHRTAKVDMQSIERSSANKIPLSDCKKSLRFSIPTSKAYLGRVRDAQLFHHSRILYIAQRQLENFGLNNGFLSIHIRVERIIRTAAKYKLYGRRNKLDFLEQCVSRIVSRIQQLLNSLPNSIGEERRRYLLVTDLGEHGTSSLTKSSLHRDAELFLKILSSHGLQVRHCILELLRDQDAHNSGFVSLVEMTMLALGRKLLLVGGGGFQVNTAHKFYSLHRAKRDVHRESSSCVP